MTEPITLDELDELVRYHEDRTASFAHGLSPYQRTVYQETVRALKMLRDLMDPEPLQAFLLDLTRV